MLVSSDFDLSDVVQHDWKKLSTIWKSVNSDYKEVYHKFTASGNHAEENFVNFCSKLKHMYYLRQFVLELPQLHESIPAGLLKNVEISCVMCPFQRLLV